MLLCDSAARAATVQLAALSSTRDADRTKVIIMIIIILIVVSGSSARYTDAQKMRSWPPLRMWLAWHEPHIRSAWRAQNIAHATHRAFDAGKWSKAHPLHSIHAQTIASFMFSCIMFACIRFLLHPWRQHAHINIGNSVCPRFGPRVSRVLI